MGARRVRAGLKWGENRRISRGRGGRGAREAKAPKQTATQILYIHKGMIIASSCWPPARTSPCLGGAALAAPAPLVGSGSAALNVSSMNRRQAPINKWPSLRFGWPNRIKSEPSGKIKSTDLAIGLDLLASARLNWAYDFCLRSRARDLDCARSYRLIDSRGRTVMSYLY